MSKDDVLIYGMIIQADIFEDGHGTSEEDEKLLKSGLLNAYGATEETSEEELKRIDELLEEDKKKLLLTYREKVKLFLTPKENADEYPR